MVDTVFIPNKWMLTGKAEWVRFAREKAFKDDQGRNKWKFLVKPSEKQIEEYDLESELDEETEMFVVELPEDIVHHLGNTRRFVFVETDMVGGETPLSRRNTDLKLKVEQLQISEKTLKSALAKKTAELNEFLITGTVTDKNLVDRFLMIRKVGGKTDKESAYDDTAELSDDSLE